ncbi:anhydro-N-acetylmuramic acid kinase [Tamilnaduibacter salinus]|uniref:Anhydro-N-acetylmuramic acid kinase n=1 Tax=Tamilnaduibacter salinus TaxID=1484056 RepID=A0A2A2I762_9GAMM|nr:anhydro-N-acetylmuramic acid kinase [Tamilnaduibacter salinus]PAV27497.1 anhydro-N-acetylmuramic acid kinase [Tamilnaduibacter salinus]
MTADIWLGLISGTSMDGIDAVLVSFLPERIEIHKTLSHHYDPTLRQQLLRLSQNQGTPDDVGAIDQAVGKTFAEAACRVINGSGLNRDRIRAIGSHGQTIRHQPNGDQNFSLQIGDPNVIAERTGIQTVADFRRRDMAAGGQGAPMVPAFHRAWFGDEAEDRCIVNIGGITNITWLPAGDASAASGFDTGPGNALLDAWCLDQTGRPFDDNGDWARQGQIDQGLLEDMLTDAYFALPAPKSTGKERFNLEWIQTYRRRHPDTSPEDVQRTLLALTVETLNRQLPAGTPKTLYICGGGAQNQFLMECLRSNISAPIDTTDTLGLAPDWVEAVAFAWLARQTINGQPGNLPSVTGANSPKILGGIWPA